jgi:hypothetical protein
MAVDDNSLNFDTLVFETIEGGLTVSETASFNTLTTKTFTGCMIESSVSLSTTSGALTLSSTSMAAIDSILVLSEGVILDAIGNLVINDMWTVTAEKTGMIRTASNFNFEINGNFQITRDTTGSNAYTFDIGQEFTCSKRISYNGSSPSGYRNTLKIAADTIVLNSGCIITTDDATDILHIQAQGDKMALNGSPIDYDFSLDSIEFGRITCAGDIYYGDRIDTTFTSNIHFTTTQDLDLTYHGSEHAFFLARGGTNPSEGDIVFTGMFTLTFSRHLTMRAKNNIHISPKIDSSISGNNLKITASEICQMDTSQNVYGTLTLAGRINWIGAQEYKTKNIEISDEIGVSSKTILVEETCWSSSDTGKSIVIGGLTEGAIDNMELTNTEIARLTASMLSLKSSTGSIRIDGDIATNSNTMVNFLADASLQTINLMAGSDGNHKTITAKYIKFSTHSGITIGNYFKVMTTNALTFTCAVGDINIGNTVTLNSGGNLELQIGQTDRKVTVVQPGIFVVKCTPADIFKGWFKNNLQCKYHSFRIVFVINLKTIIPNGRFLF